MVVANMKDLFLGIGYFLLGHILVWYQLNGQFLWKSFRDDTLTTCDEINPDDFMIYGFKALIKRRKAIFDTISKNWGISLNFEQLREVKCAADLIGAVESAIRVK